MPTRKWVCSTEPEHVFDDITEDGFCPLDPPYHGILMPDTPPTETVRVSITFPENNQKFLAGDNITISAEAYTKVGKITKVEFFVDDNKIGEDVTSPHSYIFSKITEGNHVIVVKAWNDKGENGESSVKIKVGPAPSPDPNPEVALCVILMDASASMFEKAYDKNPLTKARLVSTTAAQGIFDLERMISNPYAFVAAYKFDDRVEPMFIDTIANLIYRFDRDVKKFANYIYEELEKMQQGTDINATLKTAHTLIGQFLKGQLVNFPLKKYKVMKQQILKYGSADSVSIANVRVLIYTDGMQYDAHGGRVLMPNPFKENPIPGVNHDIVIGAFFGQENDEGCQELRGLLSRCPIHDEEQFFLFDKPGKIGNLKYLFRMASGASGFCPKCLEKELYR